MNGCFYRVVNHDKRQQFWFKYAMSEFKLIIAFEKNLRWIGTGKRLSRATVWSEGLSRAIVWS